MFDGNTNRFREIVLAAEIMKALPIESHITPFEAKLCARALWKQYQDVKKYIGLLEIKMFLKLFKKITLELLYAISRSSIIVSVTCSSHNVL